jgi:hypothetical protein
MFDKNIPKGLKVFTTQNLPWIKPFTNSDKWSLSSRYHKKIFHSTSILVSENIKLQSRRGNQMLLIILIDLFAAVLHLKCELAHTRAAALILAAPLYPPSLSIYYLHVNNVLVLHIHAKAQKQVGAGESKVSCAKSSLPAGWFISTRLSPEYLLPFLHSSNCEYLNNEGERAAHWRRMCNFGVQQAARPCLVRWLFLYDTKLIHTWRNSHPVWTTWLLE